MVVVGSRVGGRALEAGDRQVHQGPRLRDRHAGGVLGRGERHGVRARRRSPRHSTTLNPNLRGRDIREAFKTRRVPDPAGGQQVPDRLRPAAAVRHVRRQAAGRHPGRADAVAAEPGASRQGHDLRARLRERRRARSWRRSRPTTRRRSWRDVPTRTWSSTCAPSSTPPATTTTSRSTASWRVELKPNAKQSELVAAVEPVVDRLHRTYKAAQAAKRLTTISVTSILPPAMHSWLLICPNTRTTDCRARSTC